MTGTIVRLRQEKGFGFIAQDGRDPRDGIFFHVLDVAPGLDFDETLIELRVEFEMGRSDKGPKAINVRPAT